MVKVSRKIRQTAQRLLDELLESYSEATIIIIKFLVRLNDERVKSIFR